MLTDEPRPILPANAQLDRAFIEGERNRLAGRALALLVVLNGTAALILLTLLAQAPQGTVDAKIADAMMLFSGGAIAALLSSFLAYVNRTVRLDSVERARFRRVLRIVASVLVIGAGAAFLTGMNMVATISAEKSSSHPKGPKESSPVVGPSERVQLLHGAKATQGAAASQENALARRT
jgi:hypothetical protein